MKKGEQTRARMLEAAGDLVQRQGYRGAGLKRILEESSAPRGSLYFHFPGGKDQLVCEALAATAEAWKARIEEALDDAPTLEEGLRRVCDLLADGLARSGYRRGCPLATATLEAASDNDAIQRVSAAHYESWEQTIHDRLDIHLPGSTDRAPLARTMLAAIEGALLLARAYRDPSPLDDVAHVLVHLVRSARAG